MSVVYVDGANKFLREIAHNTVAFCLEELIPNHTDLDIEVSICKIKADAVGYTLMKDSHREFLLEIDKDQSLKDFILTICHEMVHVKQYHKLEMDDAVRRGQYRWKGRKLSSDTPYEELPWEKEAYKLQDVLADKLWAAGKL